MRKSPKIIDINDCNPSQQQEGLPTVDTYITEDEGSQKKQAMSQNGHGRVKANKMRTLEEVAGEAFAQRSPMSSILV